MSGHRQAALALYALSGPDQDQILARLPDADQLQLREYLAELSELGFDDAAPAPARLFSLAPRAPATPQERVRNASAQAMADLLGNEPAGLVAQVLASQAWPWHAQLLEIIPTARRALVQGALDARRAQPAAPACDAFLVGALAERLARSDVPAPRSALAQLLTKATSWTR